MTIKQLLALLSLSIAPVGDRVMVLESTKGDDGYIWYYVQFPESKAEGWIRGDLVQVAN